MDMISAQAPGKRVVTRVSKGLDRGEAVTIPRPHDLDAGTRLEAACQALTTLFGNSAPAPRHRMAAPA